MANGNYGHCSYCGKYRSLRYKGSYCSQLCYKESGQEKRDIQSEIARQADVERIWYTGNSLRSHLYRIVLCTIVWTVPGFIAGLILGVLYPGSIASKLFVYILDSRLIIWAVIALALSLVQDILIAMMLGYRRIINMILYGIPFGTIVLLFVLAKMGI